MLLAIDVGNTSIHFGIFDKRELIKDWRLLTEKLGGKMWKSGTFSSITPKSRHRELQPAPMHRCGVHISHIIICSVVPEVLISLRKTLKNRFKISPIIVGKDVKVPLKNLYKDPEQVGQDRLVGAYAAYKKYGGPVIIVDFGTAITIDMVSKDAEYLGGVIVPGVEISTEALAQRTALLPRVKLAPPTRLIATDTADSIRSGIVHGFASLCDGIVDKFKKKLKQKDIVVVATGGYSRLISTYCSTIDKVNPGLVLDGLALIHLEC